MTEDSGASIKMIKDQEDKDEIIAPTVDMKLLVEEMKKTMDKALIEALTPSVTENDSRFFSLYNSLCPKLLDSTSAGFSTPGM